MTQKKNIKQSVNRNEHGEVYVAQDYEHEAGANRVPDSSISYKHVCHLLAAQQQAVAAAMTARSLGFSMAEDAMWECYDSFNKRIKAHLSTSLPEWRNLAMFSRQEAISGVWDRLVATNPDKVMEIIDEMIGLSLPLPFSREEALKNLEDQQSGCQDLEV